MVIGQGYGMGNVRCDRLCPTATVLSLVALFSLSVSIEDRSLHWTLVKSQTYYPEHILAYGSGKACYSLAMGSGSFQTNWLEAGIGGGLSTALRPGLKRGGLESKFGRRPRPLDRSGMGWSCLCLGYKQGVHFLGYPAGHIDLWIVVSMWRYDLITVWHPSKNWHKNNGKMVLVAQPLLENRTCAYIECWIMN
jgi:hypothetical protein